MFNKLAFLFVAVTTLAASTQADTWQEREVLSQAIRELRALQSLSESAQAVADRDARIQFDYAQLHEDLATIRDGIQHYLSTPLDPATLPTGLEASYSHTTSTLSTSDVDQHRAQRLQGRVSPDDAAVAARLRAGQ